MQNQEDNSKEKGQEEVQANTETDITAENQAGTDESAETEELSSEAKYQELNDRYLRLYSEFDNYRKRTLKERSELIKTAAEDVFKAILPVLDDMERAIKANENVEDAQAIKEGFLLISNKFKTITQQKGLSAFESKGLSFDPDVMEAITHIPAASDEEKGKVIDEIEKGYKLGDKVIRFAKVVIAQ